MSGHGNSNITFALSVPDVSDHPNEIYFHISGPKDNSFIGKDQMKNPAKVAMAHIDTAFGFGVSMKKALMLIVYSNHNDKSEAISSNDAGTTMLIVMQDVTLSARTSHGNTEPSFDDSINVEIINGTGIFHDRYELNGRCQNCGDKGPIDFNSTTQQMIYAIGPDNVQLNSDSGSAGLRRHEFYGRFTIDMVQAKGDANSSTNFPLAVTANDGAVKIGHEAHDRDFGSAVHAVFMAGVFVILFPIGTVWLRIFGQVRWHWITQAVGVFIIFIGAGIGLKISKEYNRVGF